MGVVGSSTGVAGMESLLAVSWPVRTERWREGSSREAKPGCEELEEKGDQVWCQANKSQK